MMALLAVAACFVPAQDFAGVSTALTGVTPALRGGVTLPGASELANSDRIQPLDASDTPASTPQLIDADSDSDDDQDDVVVAATVGRAHAPTARTSAMLPDACISVEHRSGLERPPRA